MGPLKTSVESKPNVSVPIWCDHCHVRIAPYERSVISADKAYHTQCQNKIRLERLSAVS